MILGKASTGLVANTTDTLAPIRITNIKFPIGPSTRYRHQQKTVLQAGASGQVHAWDASQPAPTAKASDIKCAAQGDPCRFHGITVRQATQQGAGYVGYAWSGNSAGVNGCVSGGQSDSGQLANLNTDSTNGGTNAQAGYATAPCGLQQQPLLTYSLLAHGRANYYLDTTNGVVRQVALDPPAFSDPRGDQAFGAFNLESTALLLHPTGRLISINQANRKLETLSPALTATTDKRLAQLHAGQGSTSPALTEVVRDINKFSNNVMAQQLFLTLGLTLRGSGSPQAAREVLRQWATERFGAAADGMVIDNGSGLSREARVSARLLTRLLLSAQAGPVMPELMSSLSVSGVDGTLKDSHVSPGRAHLKTGTLRDVFGIAGYVLADSGRRYAVVVIANHVNASAARPAFDALIRWTASDSTRSAPPTASLAPP